MCKVDKQYYCNYNEESGDIFTVFPSEFQVRICNPSGYVVKECELEIVGTVTEDEADKGYHYGLIYRADDDNKINYIFESVLQVKLCSGGLFKYELEHGECRIVKLKINVKD